MPLNDATRCLLMAIRLLAVLLIPADHPTTQSRTAALIDVDNTPLAALLESKLLNSTHLHFLDRANIDQVLKEQQLASAFGAESVRDRMRLGRLIKADILVLLRRSKDPGADQVRSSRGYGGGDCGLSGLRL